ncbi:hypothetical protein IF655_22250 [Streptomyces sp. DSM 110735]|uniref:hypothetical protein n=1 Tax=Streptomyces sp. DSM 110735 TaxID=2775031 RepID=UPI0018F7049F|nr:hypothetical protein [Streptomyces sp. DSM 110735]MBJ7906015.1 hypothetical protein [Streptomyces sp. DSM 110735]
MRPSTNLLKGLAEACACLVLGVFSVSLIPGGHYLAWVYALGSLSFGWDAWRRYRRTRRAQPPDTPDTPEGGTSPGNPEGSAALGKDS